MKKSTRRKRKEGGARLRRVYNFNESELLGVGGFGLALSHRPNNAVKLLYNIDDCKALQEEADEWEKSVDELAAEDNDVAEYVKSLEESKDAAELPDVSGDSIAKEFERYLRRRSTD